MTVADDVLKFVSLRPGRAEAEIADALFGRKGYQQRVNGVCRLLVAEKKLERRGHGGSGDPYRYHRRA